MILDLIGVWSHALAALLYAALALWQARNWNDEARNRPLVAAFAVTALWAGATAALGPWHFLPMLLLQGRNFAFLSFMYGILRSAEEDDRQRALKVVYAVVAGVIGLRIVVAGVLPQFAGNPLVFSALISTGSMLGITSAAGSLILVHNLYGQAAPDSRWGIRLPMIALAAIWIYDLHLSTVAYLSASSVNDLLAMRGAIMAMLVPAFALASKRNTEWKMQLSRAATFQSLSLLAIFAYLLLMMSATRAFELIGDNWVRMGQIGLVFAITIAALILLPSGRARAWLRVTLAKHFFQHRYDYREEWLRFTRTMGLAGENAAPLEERVVKALADIADAPGGLLLVVDANYRFQPAARWNWKHAVPEGQSGAELARFLESSAHIINFDEVRSGGIGFKGEHIPVPVSMTAQGRTWAGVPLVHSDRLVGLVLLEHPLVRRPLDWEDYDLLRTAGIQAASYLAEARSHQALATAQRFEEFNRRFAFIMHDIKNLVSQLSLVARNAERHADNPEFRADMVATLQSSVRKMNDLLARLSRGGNGEAQPPRPAEVQAIVAGVVETKRRVHPIEVEGGTDTLALVDPARLDQALAHLVQNAIDASPPGRPVRIVTSRRGGQIAIEIVDQGTGMSAEFVRTRLFQPFASTKDGGFGIGAFEARALVAAMGGRIEIESREDEGSRFTIFLPAAAHDAALEHERKRA